MSAPAAPLTMTDTDREVLETISRAATAAHREVVRARALLATSDGVGIRTIAREQGVSAMAVRAGRESFTAEGLSRWGTVKKGRGRKPSIPEDTIAEIVRLTTTETPEAETHWSVRSMAKKVGVTRSTVHRVWSELGLKPHRQDTLKVSNDPNFEEKVIDVVGLYLNPPEKAVVLCLDEKSSIQALDRTQAPLPMVPGRAGTMTHDYKRNGTKTLFAALDVLTGKVIGHCLPKHRHEEFLRFLKIVDLQVPKGLQIHLVLDNYATHKHAVIKYWLANHKRCHLHFTPTSSSWLNQVER